jgi:hypothetical protein
MQPDPRCRVCKRGEVVALSVRKRHGALVLLGFVLFAGSILTGLIGAMAYFGGEFMEEQRRRTPEQLREDLQKAEIPEALIAKVLDSDGRALEPEELKLLSPSQGVEVQKAQVALIARQLDPRTVSAATKFILGASLIGMVIGWLLRSKRQVLRCSECGAESPA